VVAAGREALEWFILGGAAAERRDMECKLAAMLLKLAGQVEEPEWILCSVPDHASICGR
jgi:hypothetical protein